MKHRTAWPLLFLLLAVAGTVWRLAQPEASPEPLDEPVITATPATNPPEVVDSGLNELLLPEVAVPIDAGASTFTTQPPAGFDVEAYVAKWRAALAPLLDRTAPTKTIITREVDRGWRFDEPVDGGVARCEPGRVVTGFDESPRVDIFVFIDTSGSMFGVFPAVVRWLGELEYALREARRDFQLIVVANTDWLLRGQRNGPALTLDAGVIKQRIDSNDVVDVMLASGALPGGWRSFARPAVPIELLLITDDSPYGQPVSGYRSRFEALMGPALAQTRLHVMGGFDVGSVNLLGPEEPLTSGVCRPHGVSHGIEYQRLAQAYRGSRTSLCRPESWRALKEVIFETPVQPEALCSWQFELHPAAVVGEPFAMPAVGFPVTLYREPAISRCGSGARRSYVADERSLTLCPSTCVALREEGFKGLELSWTCR